MGTTAGPGGSAHGDSTAGAGGRTARVAGRMGESTTRVGVKREGNSSVGVQGGERERVRERKGVIPGSVVPCELGCAASTGEPGRGEEGGDETRSTTEDTDIEGSNNSRQAGAKDK